MEVWPSLCVTILISQTGDIQGATQSRRIYTRLNCSRRWERSFGRMAEAMRYQERGSDPARQTEPHEIPASRS